MEPLASARWKGNPSCSPTITVGPQTAGPKPVSRVRRMPQLGATNLVVETLIQPRPLHVGHLPLPLQFRHFSGFVHPPPIDPLPWHVGHAPEFLHFLHAI
jgi:hypothetical protein